MHFLIRSPSPEGLEATPDNLLPVIVKSLQDLKEDNDQLRQDNAVLEQSVNALKAEIEKIKGLVYSNLGSGE